MCIDLGVNKGIYPKTYIIRNRDSLKHILLNWILEVSSDNTNWFEIDRRIHFIENDASLN